MILPRLGGLREDERGAYAVEFALASVPFLLFIIAIIGLGYRSYVGRVADGTLQRASRMAAVGDKTAAQIDTFIKDELKDFTKNGQIQIEKKSYYQFSGVGKPEKIKQDTAPLGVYNKGDCYEDLNGNGVYDSSAGVTGLGGSDDIVYYKVTITYPEIIPLSKWLGISATEKVEAETVLRNQPFASQMVPAVKCD